LRGGKPGCWPAAPACYCVGKAWYSADQNRRCSEHIVKVYIGTVEVDGGLAAWRPRLQGGHTWGGPWRPWRPWKRGSWWPGVLEPVFNLAPIACFLCSTIKAFYHTRMFYFQSSAPSTSTELLQNIDLIGDKTRSCGEENHCYRRSGLLLKKKKKKLANLSLRTGMLTQVYPARVCGYD
jgi:hypothetical protein